MSPRKKTFQFSAEALPLGAVAADVLRKTVDDGVYPLDMAKEIALERLFPDPEQPRRAIEEPEEFARLVESVRQQGVLQPISVEYVASDDRFQVISGHRRVQAARQAGLATVPAIIREVSPDDRYVQQLMENLLRKDLSDVEKGLALKELKRRRESSWEQVARLVGLTRRRILQQVAASERLAPSVQRDITDGRLAGRHGVYLVALPPPLQEVVASAVKEYRLTSEEGRTLAQRLRDDSGIGTEAGGAPAFRGHTSDERAVASAPSLVSDASAMVSLPIEARPSSGDSQAVGSPAGAVGMLPGASETSDVAEVPAEQRQRDVVFQMAEQIRFRTKDRRLEHMRSARTILEKLDLSALTGERRALARTEIEAIAAWVARWQAALAE